MILVAPASANFMARYTYGLAEDLLSTLCLAANSPVVLAPAMNQQMWLNPATQENVEKLTSRGVVLVGPGTGDQACGENGPGRMLEPEDIVQAVVKLFQSNILSGTRLLITAGPTREPIDPVRYISNRSSGRMGTFFDHADNAMKRMRMGYQVDLVHLCTRSLSEAKDAGLIKPVDTSQIPRWSQITPTLLEHPGVRMDGEYWIVPWEWGYSTVAYNPEIIDIEDPSYDMFIDPRYKGKTALPSDISVNMLIAGVIGEWADPLDPTEAEIETAPEIFTKMLENARFLWTDGTQMEQAWAAGDVGISYIFGSATRRMNKEGLTNVIVEPLMTWMCGLSLSTNGTATEDEDLRQLIEAPTLAQQRDRLSH